MPEHREVLVTNNGDLVRDNRVRCFGGFDDPIMMRYHDEEWGIPKHEDRALFEMLILEGFQSGLSWRTILHKREAFHRAFHGFDPQRMSRYDDIDVRRLLEDRGIVRNRLKIGSAIRNAQLFLLVQQEFGDFDQYIWQFTCHRILTAPRSVSLRAIPASTSESDAMAHDLRRRGFQFVGTTVCYAFMQATGMVDDHIADCFRSG